MYEYIGEQSLPAPGFSPHRSPHVLQHTLSTCSHYLWSPLRAATGSRRTDGQSRCRHPVLPCASTLWGCAATQCAAGSTRWTPPKLGQLTRAQSWRFLVAQYQAGWSCNVGSQVTSGLNICTVFQAQRHIACRIAGSNWKRIHCHGHCHPSGCACVPI